MPREELAHEISQGVRFSGIEADGVASELEDQFSTMLRYRFSTSVICSAVYLARSCAVRLSNLLRRARILAPRA